MSALYELSLDGSPVEGRALEVIPASPADPLFTLEQAVLISLLTDRRAEADDAIPDGTTDRRGWWADALAEDGDRIGSRLWLLDRGKATRETATLAREYAEEALAWMVSDGVAAEVLVTAELGPDGEVGLEVVVIRDDGRTVALRFRSLWEALHV